MAYDGLLYNSVFTMFLGFIIFIVSIINKKLEYLPIVNQYYVLFLFLGIIISLIGMGMAIIWDFKNQTFFIEEVKQKQPFFMSYFSFGILLMVVGFTMIFYYSHLSKGLYIIAMVVSVSGIGLAINGLRFFLKEAFRQRTPQRF